MRPPPLRVDLQARSATKPDDAGRIGVDRSPAGEDSTLLHEGGSGAEQADIPLPTMGNFHPLI
eukprot:3404033-Alexandrium_andersonii.AAC.1